MFFRKAFSRVVSILLVSGVFAAALNAASEPSVLVEQLLSQVDKPHFEKAGLVRGITLERDTAKLRLESGTLALSDPVQGKIFAAVFEGSGRLEFTPVIYRERYQLALHSKQPALDAEFSQAVFYFSDGAAEELAKAVDAEASASVESLAKIYDDHTSDLRRLGLHWTPRIVKAMLSSEGASHAFFAAELNTKDFGWLSFIFDEADPEQLEVSRWSGNWHTLDTWVKQPKDGKTARQVFQNPLDYQEYVISSYKMRITVDNNTQLTGNVEMGFDLKRAGERVLVFSLSPDLRISSVRSGDGKELAFFQPPKDRGDFDRADYLAVVAHEPFAAGRQILVFDYSGKKQVFKVGNGSFFCRSFGWYPSFGMGRSSINENPFISRKDFDITLRVPKRWDAVAVGTRVEEKRDGDYSLTRWKSDIPLAVAGFAFGEYKIKTHKVDDVQVEVYANRESDDVMHQLEMLSESGQYLLTLGSLSPGRMADTMAVEVGNSLRVMQAYFGPYPYKKLAVSNIPGSYGQGWPSLLYLSSLTFLDSTQRHQLGIKDHTGLTDFFRAHETSHQWWGHVVGWKSYHDQWLSEGFAQFSGNLYSWYSRSPEEYFDRFRRDRESFALGSREGAAYNQVGPIYLGRRLSSTKARGGYNNLVYDKGGWVLHMLRMMLFDFQSKKPDERFMAMMQDFTKTHFNQAASTDDFKAIAEKHMLPFMDIDKNGRMDWFFDAWVYGNALPKYDLDYSVEPDKQEGRWTLSGKLTQSEAPADFRMIVPLYVQVEGKKLRLGYMTVKGETTSPFNIEGLGFKPEKASINEYCDILQR